MTDKNEIVTYAQQKEMGLIRRQRETFVAPATRQEVLAPAPTPVTRMEADFSLDLPTNSTQQVVMRTSGVDRAKGFAIITREVGIMISLGWTLGTWALLYFADMAWPIISWWTPLLFVITLSALYCVMYFRHTAYSAEGVALYEARTKGKVIDKVISAQVQEYKLNSAQDRQHRQDHHDRRMGK